MKGKTNAMRLLEQAKIPFSTVEYEVDESDLSGEHVAAQLGQPVEQVFKTLVVRGEKNGIMVCCIPVAEELDMKKIATLTKDRNDSCKGIAWINGIYSWRMFSNWNEEEISNLY